MTYDSVERSISSAAPAELYEFVTPTQTFRLTSHETDVVFGGNTYTAVTGSRSNLVTADLKADPGELVVEIPAAHALAQTFANGVPPESVLATITRFHPPSGVSIQLWKGYVQGLSFKKSGGEGPMAAFPIPPKTADALAFDIPAWIASRICNNVLYDTNCTVSDADAANFKNTTIASISSDGLIIGVTSLAGSNIGIGGRAKGGYLKHTPTLEQRTIIDQIPPGTVGSPGLSLTIQCAFPTGSIHVGDAISVYRGCDHTLNTCVTDFSNGINFGGHPFLPPSNVFYVGLVLARYF